MLSNSRNSLVLLSFALALGDSVAFAQAASKTPGPSRLPAGQQKPAAKKDDYKDIRSITPEQAGVKFAGSTSAEDIYRAFGASRVAGASTRTPSGAANPDAWAVLIPGGKEIVERNMLNMFLPPSDPMLVRMAEQETCGSRQFSFLAVQGDTVGETYTVYYPCSGACVGALERFKMSGGQLAKNSRGNFISEGVTRPLKLDESFCRALHSDKVKKRRL